MQFGAFISQALIEVGDYPANLGLIEHVKRMHEVIVENQVAEADE